MDALPHSGDDVIARDGDRQIGKCAFNAARALARFELAPIAAIPVGNGEWGDVVEREMRQEGLPILLRHEHHDNGWCLRWLKQAKNVPLSLLMAVNNTGPPNDWQPFQWKIIPLSM